MCVCSTSFLLDVDSLASSSRSIPKASIGLHLHASAATFAYTTNNEKNDNVVDDYHHEMYSLSSFSLSLCVSEVNAVLMSSMFSLGVRHEEMKDCDPFRRQSSCSLVVLHLFDVHHLLSHLYERRIAENERLNHVRDHD